MSNVVVFTGHMMDKPGRPIPRFPQEAEAAVAEIITAALGELGATHGYASAACGGDLLFHEAMLRRDGEIHVVLPCQIEEFRETCVDIVPDSNWGERFERVTEQASSVEILSEQCASDNAMASDCCNRVVLGLGKMQADLGGQPLSVLAFWDGRPGDAIGGTYSLVQFALEHGHSVRVINPPTSEETDSTQQLVPIPQAASSATRLAGAATDPAQKVCAIVFADAVKFSKLTERQLPQFAKHFLGGVNSLIGKLNRPPLARNTWGDGLYLVFDDIGEAGRFALALRDFVTGTNWPEHNLPAELNVRIAIHAGPVYQIHDPIIGQWSYIGSHVTRTARIEPSTPIGEVYASRTFAALTAAEGIVDFACEFVDVVALAKGYGEMPAYRVVRGSMA